MRVLFLLVGLFVYGMEIEKVKIDINIPITIPKLKNQFSDISFFVKNKKIKPFFIAKYETTKKEYNFYLKSIGKKEIEFDEDELNEPITNIDFYEAKKVCKFFGGDLPSEFEWVVASSIKINPTKCYKQIKKYSFVKYAIAKYPLSENDSIIKCMQEDDDEIEANLIGSELLEVEDSYENINGTYGMFGNVWEWTKDKKIFFDKEYRVIKGGSYANFRQKILFDNRISNFIKPSSKLKNVGFRCVWRGK
jgi:formylglycine-generating enzyme required for sulfatase activity